MKPGGLMEAIVELSHERGLDQEAVIEAIEDAIVGAAYRKYKNYKNIEAVLNPQTGEIDLMHYKLVVDRVEDLHNEVLLEEILELDSQAECGDEVEYEIDSKEFSGIIAQTARQLIFQKIREAERETVLEKYSEKKGEIVHGVVSRIERGRVIVTIANTVEAVLERHEQIPREKLQPGDHVRALLIEVLSEGRGSQLVLSRTHPDYLIKLFMVEVPEVYDGIIDVVAAAREPGKRAKIAVSTNDPDVDPIGACVGIRGSRIQTIVSELCDERIDVVEWSSDLEQFIANALAPADIIRIDLDRENRSAEIQIAQDQLSLAIGKQGQNVRLASKLTGIMIDISAWEPLQSNEAFGAPSSSREETKEEEEEIPSQPQEEDKISESSDQSSGNEAFGAPSPPREETKEEEEDSPPQPLEEGKIPESSDQSSDNEVFGVPSPPREETKEEGEESSPQPLKEGKIPESSDQSSDSGAGETDAVSIDDTRVDEEDAGEESSDAETEPADDKSV